MDRDDSLGGGFTLTVILLGTLVARCVGAGQPIVENYVGRQIPTAMVARNLDRGTGFLQPRLDVGPSPNLFLVEPPVYQTIVVGLRRVSGLPLEASGRIVSAFGIVLGGLGLYRIVARRSGARVALLTVALFGLWPITIRYGRAFQPDALMLGSVIAGIACWESSEGRYARVWRATGAMLLAGGLAMKVLSAYILAPLALGVSRAKPLRGLGFVGLTLLPAATWYVYAASQMSVGGGSTAAVDNSAIWLQSINPTVFFRAETLGHTLRFLGLRSFTPFAIPLGLFGLAVTREERRFWLTWATAALCAMIGVGPKLHHEYYWLCVAPVVSFGVAESIMWFSRRGRWCRIGAVGALGLIVASSLLLAASTWRTPPEWSSLQKAGEVARSLVPEKAWIAAPEALIYETDRLGCRVEFSKASARRAAGEWSALRDVTSVGDPVSLVDFYQSVGARFFVDVVPAAPSPERMALHESIRHRYNVIWDRDGVLIAELIRSNDGAAPSHEREDQ